MFAVGERTELKRTCGTGVHARHPSYAALTQINVPFPYRWEKEAGHVTGYTAGSDIKDDCEFGDCEFGAVTHGGTWKGAENPVNRLSRAEAQLAAKKVWAGGDGGVTRDLHGSWRRTMVS